MRFSRLLALAAVLALDSSASAGTGAPDLSRSPAFAGLRSVAAAGSQGGLLMENAPVRPNLVGPAGIPGGKPLGQGPLIAPAAQDRKQEFVPDPAELEEAVPKEGCRGVGDCLVSAFKTPLEVILQTPLIGGVLGRDVGSSLLGRPGAVLGAIFGGILGLVAGMILAPIAFLGGLYHTAKEILS